jgi:hypothetical protein
MLASVAQTAARTLAVVDIDGVVADVRHRLHFIENGRRDWGAFHSAAGIDPVLPEGRELAELLSTEHDIVWLSGRPEWLRPLTETWLAKHGLPAGPVLLRGNYDHRPAATFKLGVVRALAEREVVAAVVDDDDLVVEALAAAGFPAVRADWLPRTRGDALHRAQDVDGVS